MGRLVVLLILSASFLSVEAQDLAAKLVASDHRLSPDNTGVLAVDADALAFLNNNEFDG